MKENDAITKLFDVIFCFYFEEKNINEIYDRFSGNLVKNTNKATLYELVKYFFNIFNLSRNVEFYEKIKYLFENGEADIDRDLIVFASMSYELVEYRWGKLVPSRRINRVLEKFAYDKKKRMG